ncbi:hypothetical protein [Microbacterium paludicola]|uniref:hypothetical protein n=1 Tax=Microbacterium paludicola TaxID=300019 RepID=UPI0011A32D4F|nr:hypothetical protein [Microbacterium paludicola]
MEQRPIDGARPLPQPEPPIALAYLDEVDRIQARREDAVDRRGLAVLALANAMTLSVYVGILCFGAGVPTLSSSFLVLLALLLLWLQLVTERRETHGAGGSRLWGSRALDLTFAGVLGVVVIAGATVSFFGIDVPWWARAVPSAVALLGMGVPALRELRRTPRATAGAPRRPMTRAERWATVAVGAMVAIAVWAIGGADALVTSVLAVAMMTAYVAWWIAGRVSRRLPALGAVWAWPQWSAFAVGGAAAAALLITELLGVSVPAGVVAPLAGVILVLCVASALLEGRDA